MTVMALMASLTIPAFVRMAGANKLSTTGQSLVGTLNLARQTAMACNLRVEVRFYKIALSTDATRTACRAVQLFTVQPAGNLRPLTRILRFQDSVIISDSQSTLPNSASATSTLLAPTDWSGNPATDTTNTATMYPIPGNAAYQYISFCFLPTGETSLAPTRNWLATLILENDQITDAASHLPANYLTAQLDASTGKVTIFRP